MLSFVLAMTLQQAADLLGISPNASKQEINTVYRKLIAKYHPDMNRNKSAAEQQEAARKFKEIGQARKILLNPELAANDMPPMPQQTPSNAGGTSSARPNYGTPNMQQPSSFPTATRASNMGTPAPRQASAGAPRQAPAPQAAPFTSSNYNNAKTFHDNVPKYPDPAEDSLDEIFRKEAKSDYRKISDKIRLTPSIFVSIGFILLCVAMFFLSGSGLNALNMANPSVLMCVLTLAKLIIYDLLLSYYIYNFMRKANLGWLVLVGGELLIWAIVYFVISLGTAMPALFLVSIGIPVLVGIALIVFGIMRAMSPQQKEQAIKGFGSKAEKVKSAVSKGAGRFKRDKEGAR